MVFGSGDGHWSYFVVNAVILAFGIAVNRLGHRLAERRARTASA